jgi:xanthine dehydrogenase YagR molybdenum-binding subunit
MRDVTVVVQVGTQDIGTGSITIFTQVAADALSLPVDRVLVEIGDTALPETPGSGGSRTTASTGPAVRAACLALVDKLAQGAKDAPASPFSNRPGSLVARHGYLLDASDASQRVSLVDAAALMGGQNVSAFVKTVPPRDEAEKTSAHAFGAQFVEVRVDEDLGMVRVTRVVSAFAAGHMMNAKTARSQLLGGIVWGIGFALHEKTVRDLRTARLVTRDLVDYHVPVHADVPDVDIILVDEDDPHVDTIGAKGIGELGITGVVAAIANAVHHATGRRIRDLPIRVDALL